MNTYRFVTADGETSLRLDLITHYIYLSRDKSLYVYIHGNSTSTLVFSGADVEQILKVLQDYFEANR
jgi:hypothetical protein